MSYTYRELQNICSLSKKNKKIDKDFSCKQQYDILYNKLKSLNLLDNNQTKTIEKTNKTKTAKVIPGKIRKIKAKNIEHETLDIPTTSRKGGDGQAIKLENIVCSVIGNTIKLEQVMIKNKDACYNVSNILASSIIRVASTRIFNDPHQSILEIPVNSIDSYRRMDNADEYRSVGKFGMGFFSILYWVVNSPKTITILSQTLNGDNFKADLFSDPNNEEQILLSVDENYNRGKNGTTIIIDSTDDNFSKLDYNLFTEELEKLFDIQDVKIILDGRMINSEILVHSPQITDIVTISFKNNKIVIEDFAEGISLDVLYNSLLVPTISTKTIQMSNMDVDFVDTTAYDKNSDIDGFFITVNDVAVYASRQKLSGKASKRKGAYVTTFPSNTKLPVGRDDILLSKDEEHILYDKILKLADSTIEKTGNLVDLFYYLEEYSNYTTQDSIKRTIYRAMQEIRKWDELYIPPIMSNVVLSYDKDGRRKKMHRKKLYSMH